MNSGIYEILNSVNGKRYIGSAVSIANRFSVHRGALDRGRHHSRYLQSAWRKHGADNFQFRTLIVCAPRHLLFYEQRAIDAFSPEYNICRNAGNSLGVKWTREAKQRLKVNANHNKHWLGRKHSPETLARMSAAKMGNTHTKGKPRDPVAVAKTAAAHRGMRRSPETRAKIAAKAVGRKRSPESIEKAAAKLRGVPLSAERKAHLIGNKFAAGVYFSPERRAKISLQMTGVARPKSDEHRRKISESLMGRTATPEHRANQSAAQRGMKRSQETKDRMHAAAIAAWQRRRPT